MAVLTKDEPEEYCFICHQVKPCYHVLLSDLNKSRNRAWWCFLAAVFFMLVLAISCAVLQSEKNVMQQHIDRIEAVCFKGIA